MMRERSNVKRKTSTEASSIDVLRFTFDPFRGTLVLA